tara:strand:+ start:331 stop:471 length:141 start_codon:yes stop_codon:yes gene_type:complete
MKNKINKLKKQLNKNNIPSLTKEQKENLFFGSEENLKETINKIFKL